MKRRFISLLLTIVLLLAMSPNVATQAHADSTYEYAWFPSPTMYITQIAYESASHSDQNAIDVIAYSDIVAPFSGIIVYMDANWGYVVLQSSNKVYWADGSCDYMTVGFMHDEDITDLYVGQSISQGTPFYQIGGQGGVYDQYGNLLYYSSSAYGDHVHITVHRGKVTRGYPYGNGDQYAFNAFFVNSEITTSSGGRGEGYVKPGNSVYNGAPTDYRGLWINLLESNYIAECTPYPSYCLIEVTAPTTYIKSLPCSEKTNPDSTNVEVAFEGDLYTAIGLYQNTAGNLWYKVEAKSGGIGYMYAGDTTFLSQESSITISGVSAPTEIKRGNAFSIKGVISSEYQNLCDIAVWVYANGSDTASTGKMVEVDTASYSLLNSEIDYATEFNKLNPGAYTYYILAGARSYYALNATTALTASVHIVLYESTFSVVTDTSCSHSYSSVVTAPTCTEQGYTTYTCKSCGYSYMSNYTNAIGHSYGDWVTTTAPTCTVDGIASSACTICGDCQTKSITATGHSYTSEVIDATCTEYAYTRYTCTGCGHTYSEYNTASYSEWSTTKPAGVDESLIESRAEYRYQEKEFTTSNTSTMEGWTLYDTTTQWGDYGNWSSWSDTAVTASDTTEVETRKVYGYYYYLCAKCGAHMHGYGTCYTWAGGCGAATTNSGWHAVWSEISWDNAGLKDWHGTGTYYTYIDNELVFKWTSGGNKTQYRYRIREVQTVYSFYRWSEWSEWNTGEVSPNDDINVESRTVYRYVEATLGEHKYTSAVTAPTCTEQGYTTHTCACGDSYVDSYVEPTDHEYVGGICVGCGHMIVLLGDVNGDGEIDILDANLIVTYYNELCDLTEEQLLAADVNGDGEVDIMDANMIVAYYNEIIDAFPAEQK